MNGSCGRCAYAVPEGARFCPNCGAPDQYGDSCENCGATYSPLELKDAVSTVSGTKPSVRESEHLFLKLSEFADELQRWVPDHVP